MADDVGVRVPHRAERRRNQDPAQQQRPPLHQPVQVVAGADPIGRHANRLVLETPPRLGQIVGRRDFQVLRRPLDNVHDVAGAFGERRFVGRIDAGLAERDGVPEHVHPKGLRRLRQEHRFARNRLDHRQPIPGRGEPA